MEWWLMQEGISIHAPHEGERLSHTIKQGRQAHFNPRSPRGGATSKQFYRCSVSADFNPRSPRGGATVYADYPQIPTVISIHAPHEGERLFGVHTGYRLEIFQSTLPTRGSDWTHLPPRHCGGYFNPRSPRGGATKTLTRSRH